MKRLTWTMAAAGLAAFGCTSGGSKGGGGGGSSCLTPVAKTGTVVAHVGNDVITSDEIRDRLAEQPPVLLERYKNPAQKLEFVNNMIKFEILSQEAVNKKLDQTPEAQQQFKRMLVQELIKSYYDQKVEVSDEELKKYYDKHVDDYVKPEKIRVQQIFIAAPDGGDAKARAARADAKAKAAKLLAQIKAEQAKLTASHATTPPTAPLAKFTELAKDNSTDKATSSIGGDTRFQSADELSKTYSPEFAKAVTSLTAENPLSGVIETPKGVHIARFMGKQAATNQSFDDPKFKEDLKTRYLAESRSTRFEEYYQGLKKSANVTVDEKALADVPVPEKSSRPSGPGGAGNPMGLPGGSTMPRPMPMPGGAPHPMPAPAMTPGAPGAPPNH